MHRHSKIWNATVLCISFAPFHLAKTSFKLPLQPRMNLNFLISCLYPPSVGVHTCFMWCSESNFIHVRQEPSNWGFTPSLKQFWRDSQSVRVCLSCYTLFLEWKYKWDSRLRTYMRIKWCKPGKALCVLKVHCHCFVCLLFYLTLSTNRILSFRSGRQGECVASL